MGETSSSPTVSAKLERIASMAKTMPGVPLTTLAQHIDEYWARSIEQEALAPLTAYVRDQRGRHATTTTLAAWEQYEATRASLCELSNAHLEHHHGVAPILVRGVAKVTCVALRMRARNAKEPAPAGLTRRRCPGLQPGGILRRHVTSRHLHELLWQFAAQMSMFA